MKKSILRKVIYFICFALLIGAFIYLGDKYSQNSEDKPIYFSNYYSDLTNANDKIFEVINGSKFISLLKKEKAIVFVGSSTSKWSSKYAELLIEIFEENEINNAYYYDINNDKAQKNSTYYNLRNALKGNLIQTDGSENNLLAPSLYIIENGKVKYYNVETVAMKNTTNIEDYWTADKVDIFKEEVTNALNNYYLHNR